MKKLHIFSVFALLLSLSSCQVIGDIFKTGVGVGVFLVLAAIALVIFIVAKVSGGK